MALPPSWIPDSANQNPAPTGLPKSFVPDSQPSANPSFFQEEGQNLQDAWKTATSPQDLASPFEGGGHVANALVNTPFKHAVSGINGLLTKIPGVQNAENAAGGYLSQTPIARSVGTIAQGANNLAQNNPRTVAALRGVGNMVNAGLTVSSIGQGIGSLKNAFTGSQDLQGITRTLTENLNYDPDQAGNIANTIANQGRAAEYIANGNYEGAQAVIAHAMQGAQGTAANELGDAFNAIADMKTVGFNPTVAASVANKATGLIGGIGHTAKTFGGGLLRGAGFAGGAAGLGGLIGYPFAKYEGWLK